MARNVQSVRLIAACLVLALLSVRPAVAAEPSETPRETREFKVWVDGTERGKCTMQIGTRDDGAETVRVDASIRVNFVVYKYTYSCAGHEVWKDDRLIELQRTADYNGTRYAVKAVPAAQGLHVTVNGKASHTAHEAWPTSYWRLPARWHQKAEPIDGVVQVGADDAPAPIRPQTVPLLDSDHGRALSGTLQRVGEESLMVAGKKMACTHYRITGDVQVDLWYDAGHRLVRQQSLEDGHKTLLHLMRLVEE